MPDIVSYETNLEQNKGGVKPCAVCYYLSNVCSTLNIQISPFFYLVRDVHSGNVQRTVLIFLQQEGLCSYKIVVTKTKECIKRETVLRKPTANVGIF